MAPDLFAESSLDHLILQMEQGKENITLREVDLPTYVIKDNYTVTKYHFSPDRKTAEGEVRKAVEPVVKLAEEMGCHTNLMAALYEAVLNAHQHGNKGDHKKKVTIAYKITPGSSEIAIIDEGGEFNASFIPFVFKHRNGEHKERFVNFYEFSGSPKSTERNLGTGTSFMHTYGDKVGYFKSEKSGLVVHLSNVWKVGSA